MQSDRMDPAQNAEIMLLQKELFAQTVADSKASGTDDTGSH